MSYWHWSYRSTRDEASFLAWILWNVCLQRMHCQLLRTKNRILSTMHNVFALVKPCAKSTLLTGDADSFDAFYLAKRRNMTYFPLVGSSSCLDHLLRSWLHPMAQMLARGVVAEWNLIAKFGAWLLPVTFCLLLWRAFPFPLLPPTRPTIQLLLDLWLYIYIHIPHSLMNPFMNPLSHWQIQTSLHPATQHLSITLGHQVDDINYLTRIASDHKWYKCCIHSGDYHYRS